MLRNTKLVSVLVMLGVLSSLPVNASIITGPITGNATQGSSGNILLPNAPVPLDNSLFEFSTFVVTTDEPKRASVNFDFVENAGELYLFVKFRSEFDAATTFTVNAFTVDFTNIFHSDASYYLSNVEIAPWIHDNPDTPELEPPDPSYLDGVSPGPGTNVGTSFSITFNSFYSSDYSRDVELHLVFSNDKDDTNASFVPVPAAAPMALLGLGVLALARRFRRKKS